MLGDKPIIGLKEGTLDNKRRICLQSFSGVEKDEEVALVFDNTRKYLKVCKIEDVTIKYELLDREIKAEYEIIKKTKSPEIVMKRIAAIEEKRKILELYSCLLGGTQKVDKQKRILIPQLVCEELGIIEGSTVYLEGAYNHLNIYPSKERYHEVKKALVQRN